MRDVKAFVRKQLSASALPPAREQKIVDELAAQIEESYESHIAARLSEEEAWREIERQIPDWRSIGDELLEAEPVLVRLAQPERRSLAAAAVRTFRELLGVGFIRDLQSSVRLLIKDRGFTVTTVLTLAVCLGANVAIFTVVYSVLLRPLPIPDSDRIVALGDVYPTITPDNILSNDVPSYFDRRKAVTAFEEQALFTLWYDSMTIDGLSQELRGMRATPSLFRVLQVQPILGRTFIDAEGEPGGEYKIVLSHGLWQRLYGGDPGAIGRDVRLGWTGQRYTVVGVMPRGFTFFDIGNDGHARQPGEQVEFWIPLAFTAAQGADNARTRYGFYHIGRLRPGATIEQVKTQVDALNAATFERFPEFRLAELGMYTAVTPLQEALTWKVRRILYLLWGGAAFVLLIGVLNIANLSLARASVRAQEIATRMALGAGRLRVTRQLVLEGVLVAGAGGFAGIAVSIWILRTLLSSGLAHVPNATSIQIDATAAGFMIAIAGIVGVLIGLVPAAIARKMNVADALGSGSRLGTSGRAAQLFRRGLVVTQVAVSVILLIGAGLLLASFRNLLAVDAGFNRERVITATIFPPPSRYTDLQAVAALSDRVLEAVRAIPGVQEAGITSNIALSGAASPARVGRADDPALTDATPILPSVVSVTPGYFKTMGASLLRGRYFAETDQQTSFAVTIIDDRLAARLFPDTDPLGKGIYRGESQLYTVVGVVREIRFEGLAGRTGSAGTAYFPHTQAPPTGRLRWIAIKTSTESASVIPALRAALNRIDPELPLSDIQTMTQRTTQSVVPQRLAMGLATMFGGVALFLSALGIYGVLAYLVAQKTREIGIRMALGSTARLIFHLFFRQGLTLVAVGVILGLAGAWIVGQVLKDQVFGVEPTDPLILTLVAATTGLIALLACVSPARRATRVDPIRALSQQ